MGFTYPVTLNLKNKTCVVVGGGQVAQRKIQSLLAQEASVVVVSPTVTDILAKKALEKELIWRKEAYQPECLAGCFLAIAATNDRSTNQAIAQYCHKQQILVNVIDNKEESSFLVNAFFTQGDLLIAISTNGISPALAKVIKEELANQFGPSYGQALEIIGQMRAWSMDHILDEGKRRGFLQELGSLNLMKMLQEETVDEVKKRVRICLSSYWD